MSFLLVLVITQFIAYQKYQLDQKTDQQEIEQRVSNLKVDLQNVLGQSYNATQTLAFIVDHYGIPKNFDSVAQLLLKSYKAIDALELVNEKGIITHVYPLKNNEVIGLNILDDPDNRMGAKITLEIGDYYTAGPIYLRQGGSGIIGRKPMFKNGAFNGFTAAVVRLSTVLNAIQLDTLGQSKFSYKLVKINLDETEETFYASKNISKEGTTTIPLTTSQGEWKLYVYSNHNKFSSASTIFSVLGLLLAFVCGLLSWFLMRQPSKLNRLVDEKTAMLKESQEQYKMLIEEASDGIFLSDFKGKVLDVNPYALQIFGYSKKEILKINIADLISPDERLHMHKNLGKIIKGKSIRIECKMLKRDGSIFYGEVSGKKLSNSTILGIVRDITHRKKADEEKQRLISVIENSPGFIAMATLEGVPLFINKAGKKLVNLPININPQNISIYDYFDEKYRNIIENEHFPTLMEKGLWTGEVPLKNFKTNTSTPLEFSGFLIRDEKTNKPIALGAIGFDLTERKKIQKEILDLQGKMDAAIRIGKIGYWDFDMNTKTYICSPLIYDIYTIEPGTLIDIAYLESLIHPDDLEMHRQNVMLILKEKNTHTFSYRIIVKDGSVKYLMVETEVDRNDDNRAIKIRGTIIDITKQIEADFEILKLQNRMNAAIRIGNIGYWHWDMSGDVVEWSKEMYAIHEIDPSTKMTVDLVRKTIYHEDLYLMDSILSSKPGDKHHSPNIYRSKLKNNTFKYFLASSEVVFDDSGNPIIYRGTAMDITKSVLAEKALKESQEKFVKAFENKFIGMLILDEEEIVIEANTTVCNILNVSKEDLINKKIMDSGIVFLNEHYTKKRNNTIIQLQEKGKVSNEEFKITLKNGQEKTVLVSKEYLKIKDQIRVLVTINDDTKRKETAEILASQFNELQKTNSELDSFVYSASHELRAPLSSVLGLIQLIKMEGVDPKLYQHIDMMEVSIERLDSFIKDIIEYSRNKHKNIELEPINFSTLIEQSIESFWYLENTKKIKIDIDIHDKIQFVSDSKRVSVLLNNFISNAIKYHDLNKESPFIHINVKTSKKEAILVVKDNGVGIEDDELERIFEMFYRVSSKVMGSGIGLFIVKEVIAKLKGTIAVTSKIGQGSTFTITIPNESGKL
ncbi:PAS domain S-box protein [Maribacter sp. 1_2014MBL_MicDiv]|uniref:PAS domain S-box protein n=1 Tax=Maribacter sp. 1_2014MBL_MicDiv TaxID=1644130 RepID=UPI0018DCB851|nr:PAS domain S-box protein [Maribacter sp. 1_2014MBL_MicDiv]